jgi:beta-1,2-mannobiose phosphorylase / 1,2-beta-oligomannan phosphorylase
MKARFPGENNGFRVFFFGAVSLVVLSTPAMGSAQNEEKVGAKFPPELVRFEPFAKNPVFAAGGKGKWDVRIRERGWIMREGGVFKLWYTGYRGDEGTIHKLGYATSSDGIHWTRQWHCDPRWQAVSPLHHASRRSPALLPGRR